MDFNTFLFRFGLNPDDFENRLIEPVKTDTGFIYEIYQKKDGHLCPYCGKDNVIINDYRYSLINTSSNEYVKDTLRIRKVRMRCNICNKTFTPPLSGIDRNSRTSSLTVSMITKDFFKPLTFLQISERYVLSSARVIQIFDEKIPVVPRKRMPRVLCIDEKKYSDDLYHKYCCILYDFDSHCVSDVIKSRRLPYLEEYFSDIDEKERNGVKFFISDMFDSYKTVKRRYFTKAIHIVDLFHVVRLLCSALSSIRVNTMKKLDRASIEYRFMKKHWKMYHMRRQDIPVKRFTVRDDNIGIYYDELLFKTLLLNKDLLEAYNTLQDLYSYSESFYSFKDSLDFVEHTYSRLLLSDNELLNSVGETYKRWSIEIANGICLRENNIHYTNSVAENINSHIDLLIRISYGYSNFERFRKRIMLIRTYKKELD